ncbi:MAG: hypothetical protein WC471_00980 [Candidatus Woesearchaeota archaeon]
MAKDDEYDEDDTFSDDEEPDSKKKLSEDEEEDLALDTGKEDEDVYKHKGRAKMLEDDEISAEEEGFMEGEEKEGRGAKCKNCGKALLENVIEKEIDEEVERFCSEKCLKKYEKKVHEEESED